MSDPYADPAWHAIVPAVRAAAPGDSLPRLVAADWLDDRGQPERAEYIRLADRFAAISCTGSGRDDCRCQFHAIHRRLLGLAAPAMWPVFRPFAGRVDAGRLFHTFIPEKGFVDSLSLAWEEWERIADEITRREPIRLVRLRDWPRFETRHNRSNRQWVYRIARRSFTDGRIRPSVRVDERAAAYDAAINQEAQRRAAARFFQANWPGVEVELPPEVRPGPATNEFADRLQQLVALRQAGILSRGSAAELLGLSPPEAASEPRDQAVLRAVAERYGCLPGDLRLIDGPPREGEARPYWRIYCDCNEPSLPRLAALSPDATIQTVDLRLDEWAVGPSRAGFYHGVCLRCADVYYTRPVFRTELRYPREYRR